MSRIGEYLNMLKEGLKSPSHVVEGITNVVKMKYGHLPPDEQEEIVRRRLICQQCPFMSANKENYETKRLDDHCTLCSCTILTKTASLDSTCGAKTHNERHPEAPLPVLWEQYIKK